jgi:hypothetical protein
MTMSRFPSAPREGRLDRLKPMYDYLKKISLSTQDCGNPPNLEFDWFHIVYGCVGELLPKKLPKVLGISVTRITY